MEEEDRSKLENIIRQVLGLKFDPSYEEVIFYLENKIARISVWKDPIRTDIGIFSRHPANIQDYYPLLQPEQGWFFYTLRDAKYPNNGKQKIGTAGGFWRVSKPSVPIGAGIGHMRVLNFVEGSVKSHTSTNWYMVEYSKTKFDPVKEDEDWIIVRIYRQLTMRMQMTMPMPLTDIVQMTLPPGSGGTGTSTSAFPSPW